MARHTAKIHWSIPALLILAAIVAGVIVYSRGSSSNETRVVLDTAIEAVAAAENAQYGLAITLWDKLLLKRPGDADLLLNQAVTVLKWIDETNKKLSSGMVTDPAEQTRLTEELAFAFTQAESTIAQVAELPSSDGRTAFLQATFFEAKASQAQPPEDQEFREKAAQALVEALNKDPAQPLLACKLDDIALLSGEENANLSKQCADALYASWKAEPRNLFVLTRAGETLLKNQDPRLKEILLPSLETAKPMLSMMQSTVDRLKPQEMLPKAITAIEAGDWRQIQVGVRQWFNTLKATSGFRTDTRLVKPDIMALLDTSFLHRFASSIPSQGNQAIAMPTFSSRTIADTASVAVWFDADLDLDFDVAVASGAELQLFETNESGIGAVLQQKLALPFTPTGMVVGEFFDVDSPTRQRSPLSVAEAVQAAPETPKPTTSALSPEQIARAKRHDTYQEIVVWSPTAIGIAITSDAGEGQPRALKWLENVPGLTGITDVKCAEPCDVEGDGDLDLVIATEAKILILQNNGNRTFVDISQFSTLPENFSARRLIACDVDRDLDQDVLMVGTASGVSMLENILHSQFRVRELDGKFWSDLKNCSDFAIADLDGNASWDVSTIGNDGLVTVSTRNPATGQWIASSIASEPAKGSSLAVADLNNDTHLDWITAGSDGLRVHAMQADNQRSSITVIEPGNASSVAAIDANGDGGLDLLSLVDGKIHLHSPSKVPAGSFVAVRVRGINDSNGGGRNNHFSVGSTLELWSSQRMQMRGVHDPVVHFGIADFKPQNLRVIFNNGLTQDNTKIAANMLVEEIQELKGSCPFVYGWDGTRWQLITDLLWNAPLGLQVDRGQPLPDRRWEYLMLPGALMQPKDGYYELRVTEELWEVAYFDHMTLTAVDHPANVDVFTNEKVGPPNIAEPKVITAREKTFARSATDSHGRDCVATLSQIDGRYVQAFDELICQGLAEPHFVELDFGRLDPNKPWKLYLNGWMHPADTSLNIGMAQNPERRGPEPPSLWVVNPEGKWVCAQPFMGFPGGKPKSIVIDLAGVFQSDDHRIRIASSQQLYWDQAFVANDSDSTQVVQTPLAIESAELHYRGFGELMPRTIHQPHWYDYQTVSPLPKWPRLDGPFTRFGDVRDLLASDDDRMIVMVSGDEFIVKFKIPDVAPPPGWRRDFILHNVGWDKDADLNTLAGDGSLPLPFRQMCSYPPGPEDSEEQEAVNRKNADQLTRSQQPEFDL